MPYADPVKQRRYQRDWIRQRRQAYLAAKSCVHCGSTERLEVHHRIWSWSEEHCDTDQKVSRLAAELAKCEVLCAPCHDRLHAERRRAPCGTASAYRRGCRCSDCRSAKAASRNRSPEAVTSEDASPTGGAEA